MGNTSSAEFAEAAHRLKAAPLTTPEDLTETFAKLIPEKRELKTNEVFAAIQPDDIRFLRQKQPRNLACLVIEASGILADQAGEPSTEKICSTLNAIRLLTRVLPIIFEEPEHPDDFVSKVFWEQCLPIKPKRKKIVKKARSGSKDEGKEAAAPAPAKADNEERSDAAAPAEAEEGGDAAPSPAPADAPPKEGESDAAQPADASSSPADVNVAAAGTTAAAGGEQEQQEQAEEAEEEEEVEIQTTYLYERIRGADESYPLGLQLVQSAVALCFSPDFTVSAEQFEAFLLKITGIREQKKRKEDRERARQEKKPKQKKRAGGKAEVAAAAAPGAVVAPEGGEGQSEEEQAEGDEDEDDGAATPDEANAVWPMLLWRGGVGFPELMTPPSSQYTSSRLDLLRLLLVIACGPLYQDPQPQDPARSRFLDELTSGACPFAPTLFYSLLNEALSYDPVGYGIPYASALVTDRAEPLARLCLQVLLVCLDYSPLAPVFKELPPPPPPPQPRRQKKEKKALPAVPEGAPASSSADAEEEKEAAEEEVEEDEEEEQEQQQEAEVEYGPQFNVFRSLLSGLNDELDFASLFSGITRLLESLPTAGVGSLLPGSRKGFSSHAEVLVLLWKLLEENAAFLKHVLNDCDVTLLLGPILYVIWTSRKEVARAGEIHLCTFLLLLLSGDRAFGVACNKPCPANKVLPSDCPVVEGTYGDALIVTLHRVVVDGLPKLAPLYTCFLTIICNVSPYAKNLGVVACAKLVHLVELFSAPKFLFARQNNWAFVQQLVETLNNLVQYQYEGNAVLVYTLLRRKQVFERLYHLSADKWRAEQQQNQGGPGSSAQKKRPTPRGAEEGRQELAVPAPGEQDDATTGRLRSPSASGGAGGGWRPTEEWWRERVRPQLGLGTVLRLIAYLHPLVERFVRMQSGEDTVAAAKGYAPVMLASGAVASLPAGAVSASALAAAGLAEAPATDDSSSASVSSGSQQSSQQSSQHSQQGGGHYSGYGSVDDAQVVDFIHATTVVGILPQPHPILTRRYQPNAFTGMWFTTFLWSTIFISHSKDMMPLFDSEALRMFAIGVA